MKARHILARWERVKNVLRSSRMASRQSLWMAMLYLADMPMSAPVLATFMNTSFSQAHSLMRLMLKHELVRAVSQQTGERHRPATIYEATEKMFTVLGVSPRAEKEEAA